MADALRQRKRCLSRQRRRPPRSEIRQARPHPTQLSQDLQVPRMITKGATIRKEIFYRVARYPSRHNVAIPTGGGCVTSRAVQAIALALFTAAPLASQIPTPGQVDGTGGARTATQTRPPDSRRPRGTAVALLGWKAGIRSDAFGAITFSEAAAKIDAAGVAFVEGVEHESGLQAWRRGACKHQEAAARTRSARSRVSHRLRFRQTRRHADSCSTLPKRSRSN